MCVNECVGGEEGRKRENVSSGWRQAAGGKGFQEKTTPREERDSRPSCRDYSLGTGVVRGEYPGARAGDMGQV